MHLTTPPRAITVLLAIATAVCLQATAAFAATDPTAPYIVVYKTSSASASRATTAAIAGHEDITTSHRFNAAVHGFSARMDHADLTAIRQDPRVAEVVRDLPVQATSLVPLAAGDAIPTGVRRTGAAVASTVRQASTANVAVIDTGIDLTHPDLNAVSGTDCTGNGTAQDGNGHGTHVAGIIGARNNGSGAVGVAPGTKLWAVRVLGSDGSGLTSAVVCGIDWVTATRTDSNTTNDIAVANMSLGGGAAPNTNCGRTVGDPMHIAICNSVAAGVTYVVAAGNSAGDEQTFAPASYPEVLTVTAESDSDGLAGGLGGGLSCLADGDDTAASYSNFATRAVDIAHTVAAPGSCIRSTYPGNRYATMSGTSMAAPHVTGLVALCEGENGAHGPCWGKSPADVITMVRTAAAAQAAAVPSSVFTGAPSRPIAGRYYGDLASARLVDGSTTPAPTPPVVAGAPVITGTATTAASLTATNGTWTGSPTITYALQWLRCTSTVVTTCSAITGAGAATYSPGTADLGRFLRIQVTATNPAGSVVAQSAPTAAITAPPAVAPANTRAPAIAGAANVGSALTSDAGDWTGTAPIAYASQWLRCTSTVTTTCSEIAGATTAGYTVATADTGRYLRLRVTATNARGPVVALSGALGPVTAPKPAPPVYLTPPLITGSVRAGAVLSASPGTVSGPQPVTFTTYWAMCAPLSNTCYYTNIVASTFTVPAVPAGTRFVVVVVAANVYGQAIAQSAPTGLSTLSLRAPAVVGLPAGRYPGGGPAASRSARSSTTAR